MRRREEERMERLSLREAADRTGRSLTTLRRYIRAGRLRAEKLPGRYGPEYAVTEQDLLGAGLEPQPSDGPEPAVVSASGSSALERALRESVPLPLFQELQMKHEHLLVQYGMMRAGGLRSLDLQARLESREREVEELRSEISRLKERHAREVTLLRKRLREAALELEGRRLEIEALQEKVRGLELLTRNTVTTEAIERQFSRVMEQMELVDRLGGPASRDLPLRPRPAAPAEPDH